MIYLDTSVALAYLLSETRCPASSLWRQPLVSSRLFEYEIQTRIHARGLTDSHAQLVALVLKRINFLEMVQPVLNRALQPFPVAVRTLDALHLASADFLRARGESVSIASYDDRLLTAARALEFDIAEI